MHKRYALSFRSVEAVNSNSDDLAKHLASPDLRSKGTHNAVGRLRPQLSS